MSKSKGNVVYVGDLLKKGYRPEHIRLFLIYGYYRSQLNFTYGKLDRIRRYLDSLKRMVAELQEMRSGTSDEGAHRLVEMILTSFESKMDDDLHVKKAFDGIFDAVSGLDRLRRRGGLSAEDGRTAVANLRRVDEVLRVIF